MQKLTPAELRLFANQSGFTVTRYFEINSISFHLIFLRKVDGCWSLVSMRHIIHKFVNVYPYIAYSCEVAIHIIIS